MEYRKIANLLDDASSNQPSYVIIVMLTFM